MNITGGPDLTLMEVDEATSIIFEEAGKDANIIFGAVIDPAMTDTIMVTVIATGFNRKLAGDMISSSVEREEVTPTQTRLLSEKKMYPFMKK